MSGLLSSAVEIVWGPILVFILFFGGLYLLALSRGRALKHSLLGFKILFGFSDFGNDEKSEGQISRFKALSNALAATIGLGNIAGVAVAITQGGPGSLFWMWVSGLIGMNTKFFECTLSVLFREKDGYGEIQGGPMYYIPRIIKGRWGVYLGLFFALAGLIGTQALFQTNQLAGYLNSEGGLPTWVTGVGIALVTAVVLIGGLQRISFVNSVVVPIMCVVYVFSCLVIIFFNLEKVPSIFSLIFTEAFSVKSMGGGVLGYAVLHAFKIGVRRGAFSNEAGVGTAPMAHGNSKTSEPVSEGLVAMLGPLLDTLVVCTMTALVILISVEIKNIPEDVAGIALTSRAFKNAFGVLGSLILGVSVFFFSFSTVIGMANYNEKCWNYLFGKNKILNRYVFISVFCFMLFFGAVVTVGDVVNILDLGYGLMAYPNMLAVVIAAPLVARELKNKLP